MDDKIENGGICRMKSILALLVVVGLLVVSGVAAGDKVIVHHNGEDELGNPIIEDICISVNAVEKHLANHGDTTEFAPCPVEEELPPVE